MTSSGGLSRDSVDALLEEALAQEERRLVDLEARVRRLSMRPGPDAGPAEPERDVTDEELEAARLLLEHSGAQLRALEERFGADDEEPEPPARPRTEELDLEALERELQAQAEAERGRVAGGGFRPPFGDGGEDDFRGDEDEDDFRSDEDEDEDDFRGDEGGGGGYLEDDPRGGEQGGGGGYLEEDDFRAYAPALEDVLEPAPPAAPRQPFVPPGFDGQDGGPRPVGTGDESQDHLRFDLSDPAFETKDHLTWDSDPQAEAAEAEPGAYRTDVDDFRGGAPDPYEGGDADDADDLRGGYGEGLDDFRGGGGDLRSDDGDDLRDEAPAGGFMPPTFGADGAREEGAPAGGFRPPSFGADGEPADEQPPAGSAQAEFDPDADPTDEIPALGSGFAPPRFDADGRPAARDAAPQERLPAELGEATRGSTSQAVPRNQTRRLTRDDPGRFGLERAFGEGRGELRQLMQQQAQILTALGEIQAAVVAGRPVTGDAGGDAGGDGDEWQGRALRAEAACAHAMRVLAERRARLEELAASLEALEAEVGPGEASRRLVEVLRSGRTERPVD